MPYPEEQPNKGPEINSLACPQLGEDTTGPLGREGKKCRALR